MTITLPGGNAPLTELIRGIHIAMLTTIGPDGHLRSRPMATQEADPDGTLWFFVGRSSQIAHDIRHRQQVNVSYAEDGSRSFVSVAGMARLVDDQERCRALWREEFMTWFPLGVGDPDLSLLRIEPEDVERWSEGCHARVMIRH